MPSEPIPDPIDPAKEAGELADLFHALSQSLDEYRLSDDLPPDTAPAELKLLKRQAQEMEDLSHGFTAEAIGATLQSIHKDLAQIKAVTKEAKAQLAKLESVSKAISIATAGLSVGTAVLTGNPLAIAKAVEGFGEAVIA